MNNHIRPEQARTGQRSFNTVEPLSDEFLNTLVAELDNDEIVGIILGGSYARNEATPFSDVDIACFVPDSLKPPSKRFIYRDGRLLSIGYRTVADTRNELARPERAIFIVSGFRRVLLDKDGSVSRLMRDIETFKWGPLQEAANSYASFGMMLAAEQVHKILSEIFKSDDLALSYAISKLLSWLTEAVAVQRAVLVRNDSTYYRQVQETVGLASEWTRYHRLAAGVDAAPGDDRPVKTKGLATLCLYRETLGLLRAAMQLDHLQVAEQTVQVVDKTGVVTLI
ncbi:MAG TPA: nucleotidyltransferase domain-containing protein [Ktedonobacteraceae bacterium]